MWLNVRLKGYTLCFRLAYWGDYYSTLCSPLWDDRRRPAAARMISHDAIGLVRRCMTSTSDSTGGPGAETAVFYRTVRPALTFPGVVHPSTPKRGTTSSSSAWLFPEDGRSGQLGTLHILPANTRMRPISPS